MCDVGGLEMHGICSHSLVHKEVVEARWNYKRSYSWLLRNLACGESTGSNETEKEQVCMPPGLAWGKG